ncbi:MAG: hypothetical protein M0T73_11925 [Deltaproteobacteria bacterium]|nr:hypothetical protein [Deltaproteobacteria bacterium]
MEACESYDVENCGGLVFCEPEHEGRDCVNYYPGMLADIEEELNECREREFERFFFCGC